MTFNAENTMKITKENIKNGLLRKKDNLSEITSEIRRKTVDEMMPIMMITVMDVLIIPEGFLDPGRYLIILTFKPSWQMMPIYVITEANVVAIPTL
jgi:hypothetical protein